jgi:hypothetical protein
MNLSGMGLGAVCPDCDDHFHPGFVGRFCLRMENGSYGMGIEQKTGNMGAVTTTLEQACQLGAHQRDVADAFSDWLAARLK